MEREYWPPCQAACPISTDVQGYLSMAALGDYADSFRLARLNNPFVSSCGYICFHPCEEECRRSVIDQAVSIMAVKRAAFEHRRKNGKMTKSMTTGDKVAIVGAGPAGLTVGQSLSKLGYKPTVYEREEKAGGMLSIAIPEYRLPRDVLDYDIEEIMKTGVAIVLGQEAGRDFSLEDLKSQGFKAVVLATGLPLSRSIPVFPTDRAQVHLAIPFLHAVNSGRSPVIGEHVIVVGGGNVAIDVARSALRVGGKKVEVICLEAHEEMPAHSWEIEEATDEGIKLHCCQGPDKVLGDAGGIEGLRCKGVKSVFDDKGRFNPTFFEDKKTDIPGDTIIVAIGQGRDTSWLGEDIHDIINRKVEGVFVTGEFADGPGSCVEAIESGHRVALDVHKYLSGEDQLVDEERKAIDALPDRLADQIKKRDRVKRRIRSPKERILDLDLFEDGFSKKDATKESLRCLSCTAGAKVIEERCIACLTCVRVCPYEIPKICDDNVAVIDPVECQACGICITECPALAIEFRRGQVERIDSDLQRLLNGSKNIEFYCQNRLFFEDDQNSSQWVRVRVPCIAYIDTMMILKAYEYGAEKVMLSPCPGEECYYKKGREWAEYRVLKTKGFLSQLGYEETVLSLRSD